MPREEADLIFHALVAANELVLGLADRASSHVGVLYSTSGLQYFDGERDGLLSAEVSGDAGDVTFAVEFPGTFAEPRNPPPWDVSARLIVKCDTQPPREHWCLHDLIEMKVEARTPTEA